MKLKEKVMMMQPECVDNYYKGGVRGCPGDYSYLNEPELFHARCILNYECEECWNKPFFDKSVNRLVNKSNDLTHSTADVTRSLAEVCDTFICGSVGICLEDYPECGRKVEE